MGYYVVCDGELYHYGVKGMKWGVRKRDQYLAKEKQALKEDAKNVTVKAQPGKHIMVGGKYYQKRGGLTYQAYHLVNEHGDVKLSYIRGLYGDRYIATGKKYIEDNINLNEYFRNTRGINIEYDVYD